MPHLTSAVLCGKKPDVATLIELAEWIHENCSPCTLYLVQLDQGRAFALAAEGHHDDSEVDLLSDPAQLRIFAKHFRRPFWGGFAVGGYTNGQEAVAVDASGKVRWSSSWRFEYSVALRELTNHPLSMDEDFEERARQERAKKGYGRIGAELNADFYQLLSIERGDPLTNVPNLELEKDISPKAVEKFLARYQPPSPLPKAPEAEELYVALEGARPAPQDDATLLALMMALACKERNLDRPRFAALGGADRLVVGLKGPACAALAKIAQRDSFLSCINERLETPVRVMSVRKGRVISSNARISESLQAPGGGHIDLPAPIQWEPFPAFPDEALPGLAAGLRRYAKKVSREDAPAQVIMRTGID